MQDLLSDPTAFLHRMAMALKMIVWLLGLYSVNSNRLENIWHTFNIGTQLTAVNSVLTFDV